MFTRRGFILFFSITVLSVAASAIVSSTTWAAGEKFTMSSDGSIITITGGNVPGVLESGTEIVLSHDPSRDDDPNSIRWYIGYYSPKSGICNQDTDTGSMEAAIITSTKQVLGVNYGCNYDGAGYMGPDDWDLTSSYTQESSGGGGSNSGGQTKPSTSGNETYTFVDGDSKIIKACGGIFNLFKDECLTFTYTQDPQANDAIPLEDAAFVYTASGSVEFTEDPCQVKFVIGINKDRPIGEGGMSAKVNQSGVATGKGCGELAASDMKGMTGIAKDAKPISVAGVDKLEDFLGGAVVAEEEGEHKKTCGTEVTGIGWLMCPILTAATGFADSMWKMFEWLLVTQPLTSDTNDQVYKTWSGFRNIANSLLILAFIVVIYSQITGAGISNYGIKRMLPRIIVMSILINLSYILVQLSLDFANILGKGMSELIANSANSTAMANLDNTGWDGLVGLVISTGIGTGAVLGGTALAISITGGVGPILIFIALLLLPGLLAFIAGLIALIFRHALIPVLAILAPIAFAAYLFPNTQSLFNKWRKLFTALLMLYPMAAAYYGILKLAAATIASDGQWFGMLMALTLLFFGTGFVLYLALKSNDIAGRVMGTVQGALNKASAPIQKFGRKTAGSMASEGLAKFKNRDFSRPASLKGNRGFLGRKSIMRGIGRSVQGFDRSAKNRELRTSLYAADAEQKRREDLVRDPSALGEMADSIGGQAYLDKLTQEAAENTFKFEYEGNATKALQSEDENVRMLALKDLAGKGEWGAKQVESHLTSGGVITSRRMADVLTGMKGVHAGLAETGTKALQHFDNGGATPFKLTQADLVANSQAAVPKLANEALAKQSPEAIRAAATSIPAERAEELLENDRIRSTMSQATMNEFLAIASQSQQTQSAPNMPPNTPKPSAPSAASAPSTPKIIIPTAAETQAAMDDFNSESELRIRRGPR